MVTYVLEKQDRLGGEWRVVCGPLTVLDAVIREAALNPPQPEAVMRVRAVTTAVEPDGSIVRRYMEPEELAEAIRGEQVPAPKVKEVVVVWDRLGCHEAVYVDAKLWIATDVGEHGACNACGFETISDGQPITIKHHMLDREMKEWPAELASLRLDDERR